MENVGKSVQHSAERSKIARRPETSQHFPNFRKEGQRPLRCQNVPKKKPMLGNQNATNGKTFTNLIKSTKTQFSSVLCCVVKDIHSALPFPARAPHPLDHPQRRGRCVEADDQVHLPDVQPLLPDRGRDNHVESPLSELLQHIARFVKFVPSNVLMSQISQLGRRVEAV